MNKRYFLLSMMFLSSCASIVSGTTQEVAIDSVPSGANCAISREGRQLQDITTPASPLIRRSKYDLAISCSKSGYASATVTDGSGVEPWVFGNLIIGGLIGLIIDVSTGAQNKYDSPMTLTLKPVTSPLTNKTAPLERPTS